MKDVRRKSVSRKGDVSAVDSFPERTQAGELFSAAVVGRGLPPVSRVELLLHLLSLLLWSISFN